MTPGVRNQQRRRARSLHGQRCRTLSVCQSTQPRCHLPEYISRHGLELSPDGMVDPTTSPASLASPGSITAGLAGLFNQLARRNGIGGRLEPYTSGSIDQLHQALRNGPVVHGYFTRAGHVVVALGYDGNGYRVLTRQVAGMNSFGWIRWFKFRQRRRIQSALNEPSRPPWYSYHTGAGFTL